MTSDHGRETLSDLVAEVVRRERAGQRLRQEDLAASLGWARGTVADLEGGRRRCTLEDAEALCRALGLDLATLLGAGVSERSRDALQAFALIGPWQDVEALAALAERLPAARVEALRRALAAHDQRRAEGQA